MPEKPTEILTTDSIMTWAQRWDHILARWGIRRDGRWIKPGLYELGNPTPDSPVFVTANYSLSFDALRCSLEGMDCYILVLMTFGVNVWCAAGKGTFGTDELVERIASVDLGNVVNHSRIILPQLGASGIVAHEVRKRSGFVVEYGPVRAEDIPVYLKANHKATQKMRTVRFNLEDRIILAPVEFSFVLLPMIVTAVLLALFDGLPAWTAVISAFLGGIFLFPIFLPWLPTRSFSQKGFFLGGIIGLGMAFWQWIDHLYMNDLWRTIHATSYLLTISPLIAFIALNFTGSTPIPSPSGVRREMYRFIPIMAWSFGIGIIALIVSIVVNLAGGSGEPI